MAEQEKVVTVSYGGNSHQAKAKAAPAPEKSEKKVEAIEGVVATQRKKPLGRRMVDTFGGDDATSVGEYILMEVILPAAKNLLFDVMMESGNRLIFGSQGSRRPAARGSGAAVVTNHVAYNRVASSTGRPDETRAVSNRSRKSHDFDEIVFDTRGGAEIVLERLKDLIEDYHVATVADLYSLCDITENYPDTQYGWRNLSDARVRPTRGAFYIEFPPTVVLKN